MNIGNSGLSFGSIHCPSGNGKCVVQNLNYAQIIRLQTLIESQEDNPINVVLAPRNENRLWGWTIFAERTNGKIHKKEYIQRPFEYPMHFVERLCKKANRLNAKFKGDITELASKDLELHV